MSEINAVFFDIDGTFYDHVFNKVHEGTLLACSKLKEKGIKVVLCSGRPKEMADQLGVFELFDFDGYIGGCGNIVMNEKYETIYEDNYGEKQLTEIFKIAEENGYAVFSFGKHEFITKEINPQIKKLIDEYHLNIPPVRKWNKESLNALSVVANMDEDFSMFNQIEGIKFHNSTPYCIDFIKDEVDKAKGIEKIMEYWGFPKSSYIAFGDSMNDLHMIEEAQIGIVMGNGVDELKKHADIVCGGSDEESIYGILTELHLI